MSSQDLIEAFLAGEAFAVAGASNDRTKYGNKVLRAYQQRNRKVYPVNPRADTVEALRCYPTLADLPEPVHGLSIVTPPRVTREIVQQAIRAGIGHLWMQPGAEDDEAVDAARSAGLQVIAGGPCLLVALRFRDV